MAISAQLAGPTIAEFMDKAKKTANDAAIARSQLFQAGVDALADYKDKATTRANDQFLKILTAKGVSPTQFAADPNGAAVIRQLYRGIPGLDVNKMIEGLAGAKMSTEEAMAAGQAASLQSQLDQSAPSGGSPPLPAIPVSDKAPAPAGTQPVTAAPAPAPAAPAAKPVTAPNLMEIATRNFIVDDPQKRGMLGGTPPSGIKEPGKLVLDPTTNKPLQRSGKDMVFPTQQDAMNYIKSRWTQGDPNYDPKFDENMSYAASKLAISERESIAKMAAASAASIARMTDDQLKLAASKISTYSPSDQQALQAEAAKRGLQLFASAPAAGAPAPAGSDVDAFYAYMYSQGKVKTPPTQSSAQNKQNVFNGNQGTYKAWKGTQGASPVVQVPAPAQVNPAAPVIQPAPAASEPKTVAEEKKQVIQNTAIIRKAASTITVNKENTKGWNQAYLQNLQNVANNLQRGLDQSPDPETGRQLQYVDYMKKLAAERPQLAEQKLKSDIRLTEAQAGEAWMRGDLAQAEANWMPTKLAIEKMKASASMMEANSKEYARLMAPVHAQELFIESAMKDISQKYAGDGPRMVNEVKKFLDAFNASPEGKNYAATMAQTAKLTGLPFTEKQITEDIAKQFLFFHWKQMGTPYSVLSPSMGANGTAPQPAGSVDASKVAGKYMP